jgi:outer membrane autotransporter protein
MKPSPLPSPSQTAALAVALACVLAQTGAQAQDPDPVTSPIVALEGSYYYYNNLLITDPAARGGTWDYQDTVFTNTTTQNTPAVLIYGYSNGTAHPVTFTGTNLTLLAEETAGIGREVFNIRDGASVFLYSSTIAQTRADAAGAAGGAGNEAIYIIDANDQGGSHLYAEDLVITTAATASIRGIALLAGQNTVTLKRGSLTSHSSAAAIAWQVGDNLGSTVTLEDFNITTHADYAPGFQFIGGKARLSFTGGTLATTAASSPGLRLVHGNLNGGRAKFDASFTDATITAAAGWAIDINYDPANTTNYLQGAPVTKSPAALYEGIYELQFRGSTITGGAGALRLATSGAYNLPLNTTVNLLLVDSTLNGDIRMIPGDGITSTSGARLVVRGTNATLNGTLTIDGNDNALKSHQAIITLNDSTLNGGIVSENRGDLHLTLNRTPLDGPLTLKGDTLAFLHLANSPVAGPVSLSGSSRLEAGITAGALAAGIALADDATATLTLDNTTIADGLAATGRATLALALNNASTLDGGITLADTARVEITLDTGGRLRGDILAAGASTLTLAAPAGATLTLASNLTLDGATWRLAGKVRHTGTLTIASPASTIAIATARGDDLVLDTGLTFAPGIADTARLDIGAIAGDILGKPEIRVIHTGTAPFITESNPEPLILSHPVDYGLAAYTLENRADGAWLVGGLGTAGAAVVNSTALAASDWFATLDPVHRHLDRLRDLPPVPAGARFDTGRFWLHTRAADAAVDRPGDILDFKQHTLALTTGVDMRRDGPHHLLTAGAFAATTRTDRDFTGAADGRTITTGAGLYALWRHTRGPHLAATARFDAAKTVFDTRTADNVMRASYHHQTAGASLEAGWRLDHLLPASLWLEPAVQIALARLAGVTYTTRSNASDNRIPVTVDGARALQYLAQLSLGRALGEHWTARARLACADIDLTGGGVTAGVTGTRLTGGALAGTRLEAALGLARRLTRDSLLSLDYDYSRAQNHTRPWSLSLSYTRAW